MVIQRTVNPPPLARLVRSQYSPPSCQVVARLIGAREPKLFPKAVLVVVKREINHMHRHAELASQ
jgi:hypothetical protein